MKIIINPKEDKKLLQNFPNDPYHDITIHTSLSKLELVLAYLSIDSQFFANIEQNVKQLDLSHLNEQPLLKVLRSLYGAQLIAYSIQEIIQLYRIIQLFEIQDYKTMLKDSIKDYMVNQKQSSLMNSIELLEFCLSNQVLANQMKQFHFDNKLKILQTSKNYLQLGKISQQNLSILLLQFNSLKVDKGDQIINHIMENYFNRKNIRPANYFMNQELQQLKTIWQKYHHKINFLDSDRLAKYESSSSIYAQTCNFNQLQLTTQINSKSPYMRKSQTNFDVFSKTAKEPVHNNFVKVQKSQDQEDNRILDAKIISLQSELKKKNDYIKNLRKQLKQLKEQKQRKSAVDSDKQDHQTSLLDGLKNYKTKKNKEGLIFDLQNIRQVQSFDTTKQQNRVFMGKKEAKRIFQ